MLVLLNLFRTADLGPANPLTSLDFGAGRCLDFGTLCPDAWRNLRDFSSVLGRNFDDTESGMCLNFGDFKGVSRNFGDLGPDVSRNLELLATARD